jgi:hypothetical protein
VKKAFVGRRMSRLSRTAGIDVISGALPAACRTRGNKLDEVDAIRDNARITSKEDSMKRKILATVAVAALAVQATLLTGCSTGHGPVSERQTGRADPIDDSNASTVSGRVGADASDEDTSALTDPSWRGD